MIEFFPLEVFPGGGFDSSIIPVIFIGLLCLWGLTESLGFVFVGLVVPGYLASVLVIAPASAGVVLVESIVCYLVVRGLSDWLGKAGAWSPFFGRDRFFAFVVVAVVVRLVGEMWLWPEAWRLGASLVGGSIEPPGPLNSIGLVLVPLAANMFWKVGMRRGMTQLVVPTAIVYLVTTQLLLPYTNLRLSEFRLNYEDVAIDFLSSPRTYIILISAAVLSARFNLRFGWNFGGILVPALLAISWVEPSKALITFGEVIVLVGLTTLVMKAPVIRAWNLEGPRKIVLVFTVGFVFKYLGSWAALYLAPGLQLTDFFGFGYLLSSLLALKVIENGFGQTYLPTLAVSILGFLVGAGVAEGIRALDVAHVEPAAIESQTRRPIDVDRVEYAVIRQSPLLGRRPAKGGPIKPKELDSLESLVARAHQLLDDGPLPSWRGLAGPADELGLVWRELRADGESRAFLLAEPIGAYPQHRGWGAYVFRPGATGPVLQVPRVNGEAERVMAALALGRGLDASVIQLGAVSRAGSGREVEPQLSVLSPFHRVHLALNTRPVIQVRVRRGGPDAVIYAGRRLDPGLGLSELRGLVGEPKIVWRHPDDVDRQRDTAESSFTTLELSDDELAGLAGEFAEESVGDSASGVLWVPSVLDLMQRWVVGPDARIAPGFPALDPPPTIAEMELIDRSVVTPLVELSRQPLPAWRASRERASIEMVATSMGMALEKVRVEDSDECYWALSEPPPRFRGLGMALLACDARAPLVVEVPYPRRELSTWRFAAELASQLESRALLIGSPIRSGDGALMGDALEPHTMLSVSHRVLQREYLRGGPPWAMQVRGLADDRPLDAQMLLSLDRPLLPEHVPGAVRGTVDWLTQRGLDVELDHGQLEFAPLRGLPDATHRYSRKVADGRFMRLWLRADFRDALTPSPTASRIVEIAASRGIEARSASITTAMSRRSATEAPAVSVDAFTEALDRAEESAQRFASTRNPVHLQVAMDALREVGAAPNLVVDRGVGQAWLVAEAAHPDGSGRRVALRLQTATYAGSVEVEPGRDIDNLAIRFARRLSVTFPGADTPEDSTDGGRR